MMKELKIDQNYEFLIDDLDMLGRGIAHYNGQTVFIDNALPDEKVVAKIIKQKGNISSAKNEKILKESDLRATPLCQYFNVCGGCDLQHLKYLESLNYKKKQVVISLNKIAGLNLEDKDIEILASEKEYFYRNKATFQVVNIDNIATLCMYEKESHNPINVSTCKIANEKIEIVIKLVNKFFKENKLLAYNEMTKLGNIKNVVTRIINNDLLLTFVVNKNSFVSVEYLYEELKKHFNNVGINLNINSKNNEILSDNFKHLVGVEHIKFTILNINQNITNASFLQVNFDVQNFLYNYVLSKVSGDIVNAYSGAGLLTCLLAKNNEKNKIIGIELNKEATKLADIMKKENNINNITNICGDASKEIKKLNIQNYTLIIDPPRSGISNDLLETLKTNRPNKIVYISCSPKSLGKNLKHLIDYYNIEEIKIFDMFPQTKNVETVLILSKK